MSLVLRRDRLAELTPGDLASITAGGVSFDNCITWICTPLVNAITQGVTTLSVATCP